MEPPSREITVDVPDGTTVVVNLTLASDATPGAPVVLCVPAMGVRASYYRPLIDALRHLLGKMPEARKTHLHLSPWS